MTDRRTKRSLPILIIRWIARIWSILSVGGVIIVNVAEVLNPTTTVRAPLIDWLMLLFFPAGVCVGMALAWRWEGMGGGIAVGSLGVFYLMFRILRGTFPPGSFFVLLSLPGFLFLICWLLLRRRRQAALGV